MSNWIDVQERLPERPEHDWVLVQTKMTPEGWYGVPHVAELRSGVWYTQCLDKPMEYELAIEVTHWMSLPEPPTASNNEFKATKAP